MCIKVLYQISRHLTVPLPALALKVITIMLEYTRVPYCLILFAEQSKLHALHSVADRPDEIFPSLNPYWFLLSIWLSRFKMYWIQRSDGRQMKFKWIRSRLQIFSFRFQLIICNFNRPQPWCLHYSPCLASRLLPMDHPAAPPLCSPRFIIPVTRHRHRHGRISISRPNSTWYHHPPHPESNKPLYPK